MKRSTALILLLCLLPGACSISEPRGTETAPPASDQSTPEATDPVETTPTEQAPGTTNGSCSLNWLLFTKEDFDEYQEHFRTAQDVPESFVYYEQLRELGEFVEMNVFSYGNTEAGHEYEQYQYYLQDKQGCQFRLDIFDRECNRADDYGLLGFVDRENMRRATGWNGDGVYIHDVIRYYYSSGRLKMIEWEIGGLCFHLVGGNDELNEYPAEYTDTFIGKLLSLDTAGTAIGEFKEMINTPVSLE